MNADELRRMIGQGWAKAKSISPAEQRIHELALADRLDEATPDEVLMLLYTLRDVRRTWHPLCVALEIR